MKVRGLKNQKDISDEAQVGPADVLARPWFVHALLGLGFAQPIATAMACAPARRADTPVRHHHPGSLVSMRARWVLMLGVLALCASLRAAATTYGDGGDFTLNGPDGPLSLSDLRGKVVLIFFGYTACPDVCPLSLARIDACFSAMNGEELERVRALFITLDPERDTLDRLQKYTGYFHPNIIGLSDGVEAIEAVTDQYGVEYSKNMMPDSTLGYSISHPTDILLLDTQGQIVETVPHDSTPKYLLARIRDLLNASD